jgi:Rieske Fe-S protein
MAETEQGRRRFLKIATVAIGGIIGLVTGVPLVRYLLYPVGRRTVSSVSEPVDVAAASAIAAGAPPVRVTVYASTLRDAWSVTRDVPLGAAWLVRTNEGQLQAFTSVCPHLGCAVDFDAAATEFRCPCHTSAFGVDGAKKRGPTKRGMDALPVEEKDGRVLLTYKRFRTDVSDREEV